MYDQCDKCACFCGNWDKETEQMMETQGAGEECSMGRMPWYEKVCYCFSPVGLKCSDPNLWKRNLGVICSGAYYIFMSECGCHEDVNRWNAPGECHGDVSRQHDRERFEYWESIRLKWGASFKDIKEEFEKRVKTTYSMHCLAMMIFD